MLTKLLSYLGPNLWNIGWVLLQVLLIAGFELLKPWPLQVVIDNVLGSRPFPIASLSSSRAGLLLLACTAIVFVQFGAGALTPAPQLYRDPHRSKYGERPARRPLCPPPAIVARLPRPATSGRSLYRITADSFAVQTMIMNGALPIL